ncbi:oxidase, partial [Pseudomonas sp. GW460-R15]
QVQALPQVEIAAVNQCSGNSRGLFGPRVPGAQWGNGAIGNALWTGVRLRDLLERAGVAPGAVQVQFAGLDRPPGDA